MSDPTPTEDPFRRSDVEVPSGADLARQLAIVAVALVVWFGAFDFAMSLPGGDTESARTEQRRMERARAAAVDSSATTADSTDTTSTPGAAADEVASAPPAGDERGTSTSDDPAADESVISPAPEPAEAIDRTDADAVPAENEVDPVMALEQEAAMAELPDVVDHPPVSFEADVLPIIERRCVQCHGDARDDGTLRIEEGLDLRTHEAIMSGSTWGSVVEPGDPVGSYMLELVLDGEMPDEGPRLLPREVRLLTAWIAQGAPNN